MVKHTTTTICRQICRVCLSVFEYFVGLALKELATYGNIMKSKLSWSRVPQALIFFSLFLAVSFLQKQCRCPDCSKLR